MKKLIFLFIITSLFINKTNSQSIHFESLSWYKALSKAKQENKIIFVDMYTTWCTYCRQMDQNIFSIGEVGSFYNTHFINIKYDALKSDGIQIRKNYSLLGFPTFIYLDPNGLVLLKTVGYQEKEKFIQNGDSAFVLFQNRNEIKK